MTLTAFCFIPAIYSISLHSDHCHNLLLKDDPDLNMSRMESWMSEAFLHGEKICKKVKENKVQGLKWKNERI